jgi:hypothetical protein
VLSHESSKLLQLLFDLREGKSIIIRKVVLNAMSLIFEKTAA